MYRATEEEIKRSMLSNVRNTVDKTENSILHDALSPAALEFQNAYMQLEYVAGKIDVENLEGLELEMFVKQRTPLRRHLFTRSSTIVSVKGIEGSAIRAGDLVSTGDVLFIARETKRIEPDGTLEVLVESELEGSAGNVPAHSITIIPVSIPGIISVTNIEEVKNGYDDETDNELRARYYERIRLPITSGNKYHYISWAKEVTGVGDTKVIPLWKGPNTVKVIIIDSNKTTASTELISEVQEYIDPGGRGLGEGEAPIGAFCTVVSAKEKKVNISAKIERDEDYSLAQIKRDIEDKVLIYLKSLAFRKAIVSYAYIGASILDIEGVLDYTNLTMNSKLESVRVEDEEVAILGEVVLSE